MQNVLISIRPKYVTAIMAGTKTIELRRRFLSKFVDSVNLLIYSTGPTSEILATAKIETVHHRAVNSIWKKYHASLGVQKQEFQEYFDGLEKGYAIELSKVRKLSKSVTLGKLQKEFGIRPPQSYMFIDDDLFRTLSGAHEENPSGHEYPHTTRRQRSRAGELLETSP